MIANNISGIHWDGSMIQTRKPALLITTVLATTLFSTAIYAFALEGVFSGHSQTDKHSFGFIAAKSNDPPGSIDPGSITDIAWTKAKISGSTGNCIGGKVTVNIGNAYPSYSSTIKTVIANNGPLPVKVTSVDFKNSSALTIGKPDIEGKIVAAGKKIDADVSILINDSAQQNETCYFSIGITGVDAIKGTVDFWYKWREYKTFTKHYIEKRLRNIDSGSCWLGPTATSGMESALSKASSGNAKSGFLGHYLAIRLNVESSILDLAAIHDVTGYDPGNYLGIAHPSSAKLADIIKAIECKSKKKPSEKQFAVMRDICNALNDVQI